MKKERVLDEVSVQVGSKNVYADLGYRDSEEMLLKAQLVTAIAEIIEQRGLTQQQAAKVLRLTQPKISGLLRGQFRGISEQRLLQCLTLLGRDVQIVVRARPRKREGGRLSLMFA